MSYDISLNHPVTGEELEVNSPHFVRGGTYAIGGSKTLSLNITWNYAPHFYKHLGEEGIRTIYGMSGAESLSVLNSAIDKLGNDVSDNYWEPTEGNAKTALIQLRAFAQMRPDGIWNGD